MNSDQAWGASARAGPSGVLLSRTGTTPGVLATSTQLWSPLEYEALNQSKPVAAAFGKCLLTGLVHFLYGGADAGDGFLDWESFRVEAAEQRGENLHLL